MILSFESAAFGRSWLILGCAECAFEVQPTGTDKKYSNRVDSRLLAYASSGVSPIGSWEVSC